MPTRSPDEIRASIEQNRQELSMSLDRLRGEVVRLTDWRSQLQRHQQQAMIAAGVAGFVVGGGLAALGTITFGRRRKKQQPQNLGQALKAQLVETVAALSNR
jgi:uncharacterized membrane protein